MKILTLVSMGGNVRFVVDNGAGSNAFKQVDIELGRIILGGPMIDIMGDTRSRLEALMSLYDSLGFEVATYGA